MIDLVTLPIRLCGRPLERRSGPRLPQSLPGQALGLESESPGREAPNIAREDVAPGPCSGRTDRTPSPAVVGVQLHESARETPTLRQHLSEFVHYPILPQTLQTLNTIRSLGTITTGDIAPLDDLRSVM